VEREARHMSRPVDRDLTATAPPLHDRFLGHVVVAEPIRRDPEGMK
jgi:hypothetical protein